MGKITHNNKDMSEAHSIRPGEAKKLVRITKGGKVLNLPITYHAPKTGLIQDDKVRIWNNFTENKDNNLDAEYFFNGSNGYGFQTVARHANTTAQFASQWDAPLIIRDYKKYDKIEITFTMYSKLNAYGSNSASIAGSKGQYDSMLANIDSNMIDVNFLVGGTTKTRTDHMKITIENIGATHPKVRFANANFGYDLTRLNHVQQINVAWTNRHEQAGMFMGTGGDSSVVTSINHMAQPSNPDFSNWYGTYVGINDWCIASAPYINDVSSAVQGMSTAIQDMTVKLYLK